MSQLFYRLHTVLEISNQEEEFLGNNPLPDTCDLVLRDTPTPFRGTRK